MALQGQQNTKIKTDKEDLRVEIEVRIKADGGIHDVAPAAAVLSRALRNVHNIVRRTEAAKEE